MIRPHGCGLRTRRLREKWPASHIIGKDILVPAHGIYWPIMLHAMGLTDAQIPRLLVHGFWNIRWREVGEVHRQHRRPGRTRR